MKLKSCNYLKTALVAISAVALNLSVQAQTVTDPNPNLVISWNLDDTSTVNPTDLAGLAPATNWVDTFLNNITTSLPDNTGAATTLDFGRGNYNTYHVQNNHPGYDANGTANREMLNGFLNSGPAAWGPYITNTFVSLTNIPYARYDVIVYFNSDTSGRHASIDNGSTTNYFSTVGSPSRSGANALFLPATETNSTKFPSADFAFFPGMTNSNAVFMEYPLSGNDQWLGIAAFQVIQSSNTYIVYGPAPATQVVPVGQPLNFNIMAGGQNPAYQWRHAGTNIDNATNATYSIPAATTGQDGDYDVIVSNSFSSVTSVVATVTFYTPKTVTWAGTGSTWDTTELFWTTSGGVTATNYTQTDNVRFDPLGAGQSYVYLSDVVTPGSITVSNGYYTFSGGSFGGSGSLHLMNNGTMILDTVDTRTGPTTIDNGSTLQLDNGDTAASLGSGALTNNGALLFNAGGDEAYGYPIYGTGSVTNMGSSGTITLGNAVSGKYLVQSGGGTLLLQGDNVLSGGLVVSSGTVWARSLGALGNAPVLLTGGELQLYFNFDFSAPSITLAGGVLQGGVGGNNSYDGTVILATDAQINVGGNDTFTLKDTSGIAGGSFNLYTGGGGTLILSGTNNTWGSLTINLGTLQIGNGAGGSLGGGYVDDEDTLAFDLAGDFVVTNNIYGGGGINQNGAGTTYFATDLSGLYGVATVSAGGLGGTTAFGGPVNILPGGTLAPGTASAIGTMTLNSDLTIGGNVAVKLDKSLVQSNDLVTVYGTLSNTNNGVVTVNNLGSALAVGDRFTLFSQPVTGGELLAVSGGGVTWSNNLANDGSIIVLSTVVSYSTNISYSISNGTLSLTWPATHQGWILQYQTNALSSGLSTNWVDVPGSASVTSTNLTISSSVPAVFYRLRSPN